jgi:hypothetical protein
MSCGLVGFVGRIWFSPTREKKAQDDKENGIRGSLLSSVFICHGRASGTQTRDGRRRRGRPGS